MRTLNHVAMFDEWGEGAVSKNVVTLEISVDPNATEAVAGSRPTAVILSRLIGAIGRYFLSLFHSGKFIQVFYLHPCKAVSAIPLASFLHSIPVIIDFALVFYSCVVFLG